MKTISITVDLETDWGGRQSAQETNLGIEFSLPKTLETLNKRKINATFFVCGDIMESYSDIVLEISETGHEIQCHGYTHENHAIMPKKKLIDDIKKCRKIFSNFGLDVTAFRAPQGRFSERLFEVLNDVGFAYDSSVIRAWLPGRFDNRSYPLTPFKIGSSGNEILEIPISPIPKLNLPFGLTWVNTMGFGVFKKLSINMVDNAVFYMHPFDMVNPKPDFSSNIIQKGWYSFRQSNMDATLNKILDLFSDKREFVTLGDIHKKFLQSPQTSTQ